MSGVLNNTARQFNLRGMSKDGHKMTVRVAPGLNDIKKEHWDVVKDDEYTKRMKKEGHLDFGKAVDDMLLENEPATKSKSKSQKVQTARGADKTKPPID